MNNISVGWHVRRGGDHRAARVRSRRPPGRELRLRRADQQLGFDDGSTGNLGFWVLVLPIGFLLAMYTQTGYDASAHTAEETRGRGDRRGPGRVALRVLLGADRLVRPAGLPVRRHDVDAVNDAGGFVGAIFTSALDSWAAKLRPDRRHGRAAVLRRAGLTSASRTWYAFSRDRGMPGWAIFRRVNRDACRSTP